MATRLFLIRHGAVPANRDRQFIGDRDEQLTDEGREQIRKLAIELADVQPAAILSSPLSRARETAEMLASAPGIEVEIEPRLKEQSFGEWEGRSFQEFTASEAHRYFSEPEVAPPGGESLLSVRQRVLSVVADLGSEDKAGPIYFVSHVGPIKTLIAEALDIPLRSLRRLILDPGTVTVIDWGKTPLVRVINAGCIRIWPEP
jgi:broad specificity phosphatase PhoE